MQRRPGFPARLDRPQAGAMTPTVPAARLARETQPPKPQGVGLDSAAVRARMVQRLAAAGITAAPLSPQEWRALLRAKGWKQKELARRWNVSETWISKLANNPERGTHWNDACRGLPDIRARRPGEPRAAGTDAPEPGGPE